MDAVKVVLDSEDSNWLARHYPSPYTAAHRFGIIMALNCVFMRVDVNDNFLTKAMCAQGYFFKRRGEIFVSLYILLCVNVAHITR